MPDDRRPDSDVLLRSLRQAEETAAGRLKIFSVTPQALARPTPCWRLPAAPKPPAWTW